MSNDNEIKIGFADTEAYENWRKLNPDMPLARIKIDAMDATAHSDGNGGVDVVPHDAANVFGDAMANLEAAKAGVVKAAELYRLAGDADRMDDCVLAAAAVSKAQHVVSGNDPRMDR